MKKVILLLLFLIEILKVNAQDTIISYPYPNGIITNQIDSSGRIFRFTPIDNPGLEIKIRQNETISIFSPNRKQINADYKPGDCIVLQTEPRSGKIFYSNVVDCKYAKTKDLFKAVSTIPNGTVKYTLQVADESEYSYQKYLGSFIAKFAGDSYVIEFNLLIKFKDGRIKYEYSDFISSFDIYKSAGSINPNRSSGKVKKNVVELEKKYGCGERNSDIKQFWKPINENIESSIKTITKLATETLSQKKNDW